MTVSTSETDDSSRSAEVEPVITGPRISFSADFLDDKNFISISPSRIIPKAPQDKEKTAAGRADFEFLSNESAPANTNMIAADELFFEGKLLPFWQMQHSERLTKISLKPKQDEEETEIEEDIIQEEEEIAQVQTRVKKETHQATDTSRMNNWFTDEDPSPRPPKCTLLWKELLRLKKQRSASTLSPSSSSSSSSSSNSSSAMDIEADGKQQAAAASTKGGLWNRDKHVKRIKKGLERTRSTSIRIKPVLNMPLCSQGSSTRSNFSLPPLFPISLKKISVER
ncbi:hypothetical protein MKW94_022601 [Papaver nudicaule]|uniref:Uncharacterized protein n=1 Tax=Papaver nudicaule TaxID=74823 RepID=A0AA41SLZ2_PAPNU|nr:hypothetical protein [Papaver nudicaule]